jgi:hypothetical protein
MFKIEMTYNGKPFDPDDFINDIIKASIDIAVEHVKKTLHDVVCPIHGKHLEKVTVNVENDSELNIKLSGCCDKIIELAEEKLGDSK